MLHLPRNPKWLITALKLIICISSMQLSIWLLNKKQRAKITMKTSQFLHLFWFWNVCRQKVGKGLSVYSYFFVTVRLFTFLEIQAGIHWIGNIPWFQISETEHSANAETTFNLSKKIRMNILAKYTMKYRPSSAWKTSQNCWFPLPGFARKLAIFMAYHVIAILLLVSYNVSERYPLLSADSRAGLKSWSTKPTKSEKNPTDQERLFPIEHASE